MPAVRDSVSARCRPGFHAERLVPPDSNCLTEPHRARPAERVRQLIWRCSVDLEACQADPDEAAVVAPAGAEPRQHAPPPQRLAHSMHLPAPPGTAQRGRSLSMVPAAAGSPAAYQWFAVRSPKLPGHSRQGRRAGRAAISGGLPRSCLSGPRQAPCARTRRGVLGAYLGSSGSRSQGTRLVSASGGSYLSH